MLLITIAQYVVCICCVIRLASYVACVRDLPEVLCKHQNMWQNNHNLQELNNKGSEKTQI